MKKSTSQITPTYHYIDEWYRKIMTSAHDQEVLNQDQKGLNIRQLFISSYQIFQNFKIDLTNKEGKALPVLILAGVNGSGKTTLLEYLKNFNTSPKFDGEDLICLSLKGKDVTIHKDSKKKETHGIKDYKDGVVYLPIDFENLGDLESQIRSYINELMFEKDFKASEAYEELRSNIHEIFSELSLGVSFSGLDREKNILFKNDRNETFGIHHLSTGEKTLFSKVLSLYLGEVKNKVVLIDEPEISLHPTWQNSMLSLYERFARENNNQIIIATHSPHILASAKSESIRVLSFKNGSVEVLDNFKQSFGLEFSKILTDIMGVEHLRTPEIERALTEVKTLIVSNQFKTKEFQNLWNSLEKNLGPTDLDLKLLKMQMELKRKNV